MVEGKGFIASPSRLSAYFAENSRRQTALEGPLEPFRVPIRPHFSGARRRQNNAGLRQTPWTTRRAREVDDLALDGPRFGSRGWAPSIPFVLRRLFAGQRYSLDSAGRCGERTE